MMSSSSKEFLQLFATTPDHELQVWEKWMKIRKEEIHHLARCVDKQPIDLVMNQADVLNVNKERIKVLENARLKAKPINPFWELPERLKQRCPCEGVYEVQIKKEKLGKVRSIEHITVPKAIQKEKGVVGTLRSVETDKKAMSAFEDYRNKREKELREFIDPHRPEMNELIIRGETFGKVVETNDSPRVPTIIVQDYSDRVSNFYREIATGIFALKINDTVFRKQDLEFVCDMCEHSKSSLENTNVSSNSTDCTWNYYFETPVRKMCRRKLVMENQGTLKVRYFFKSTKKSGKIFDLIPNHDRLDQHFFFAKNEDVIMPGQIKEITFTFLSEKPGLYEETWELCVANSEFSELSKEKLSVNLIGDSVEDMKSIKHKIQERVSEIKLAADRLLITSLLDLVFTRATSTNPEKYPYRDYFVEGDLFGIKNPHHYYHQTKVEKLKDTYLELTDNEWDLSIANLRQTVVEQSYDKRMNYYAILKTYHQDLLKPWLYYESDLLREKQSIVNLQLSKLLDKFYDVKSQLCKIYGLPDPDDYFRSSEVASDVYIKKSESYIANSSQESEYSLSSESESLTIDTVRNVFYLHMYQHVSDTIESCAGFLSSIEMNRYIEFKLCPKSFE